ncbi:family 43 glycosylhydrolase [Conyzicola nivalis]|uniref:Glycosyl hydrolase n=1 Tax=Conyzicola nivalis TaxID=1477021 RepID=A0A916WKW0_9MICO|nr:family 43 glycosylhydrolase [Conyzicola nivalis]GGB07704.1 glycosyl hydrolase [Conyzicola nivalis]
MGAPIYRDELWEGASDPTVIEREGTGEWWMFYTQRRALLEGTGVEWVHGSRIAVAVSTDGGASWRYRGVVDGLDPEGDPGPNTHWAPEVVRFGGRYHMYLTWIAGIPDAWAGHERHVVHFESETLESWTRVGRIDVGTDFAIDAAVARTPDGLLRLWFKNEQADSTTFSAVSDDGYDWAPTGLVIGGAPHEGPNVFELGGWWWLIVDEWRGLGVYRGTDGVRWERQNGLLLAEPGADPLDREVGRHASVVVGQEAGLLFYFTHPGFDGVELEGATPLSARRTAIHVARLSVSDGVLAADREFPGKSRRFLPSD